ncbi:hypothetical protein F7725_015019, partial [Dissostichus mawsoni]
ISPCIADCFPAQFLSPFFNINTHSFSPFFLASTPTVSPSLPLLPRSLRTGFRRHAVARYRRSVSAVMWIGLLWSRIKNSPPPPPPQPPSVTLGSTKDSPPKSRTSLSGGFLQSVLTQKARLLSQRGDVLPSTLPQNLLPLLGRGLSAGPLPGAQELPRRGKPPSAADPGPGGAATTEATHTHSPSLPNTHTHTPELPNTHTHTPELSNTHHTLLSWRRSPL